MMAPVMFINVQYICTLSSDSKQVFGKQVFDQTARLKHWRLCWTLIVRLAFESFLVLLQILNDNKYLSCPF